jgi:HemK-like putative methylase
VQKIALHFIDKSKISSNNYKLDVQFIILHYLKIDKNDYFLKSQDIAVDLINTIKIFFAIYRRKKCEPIAYILKETEFFGRKFLVDKGLLIPRSDSEIVIEETLNFISKNNLFQNVDKINILDLCCGTGVLGLTLFQELKIRFKNLNLNFLDISKIALKNTKKNCNLLGLSDFDVINENIFDSEVMNNLSNYSLIIYNPPYIPTENIDKLARDIKDFEPHLALDGGESGFIFYKLFFDKLHQQIDKIKEQMLIVVEIDDCHIEFLKVNFIKLNGRFNYNFFDDFSKQKRLMLIYN